jgi:hypothetical protein
MSDAGYNPMRWDCERQGCFNKKCRPKIEVFHDLFPGRINFSDIDGIVEMRGHGLLLEWKREPIPFNRIDPMTGEVRSTGQGIMYGRLTRGQTLSVLCAAGDAEMMEVTDTASFFDGEYHDWATDTLDGLRDKIGSWVKWVKQRPMPWAR